MDECPHGMVTAEWCSWCKGTANPAEPHVSTCIACEADIMWVFTEKGKRMPIDVGPGGGDKARFRKERTERDGAEVRGIVHYVKTSELPENTKPMYMCHFDSCTKRKATP